MENKNQKANLFQGFSQDEALKILSEAKEKKDKAEQSTRLVKQTSEGIVFMKASQYDKWYADKPEVYALLYTYEGKGKTKQVTALCKKQSFFKELARMSKGSKLSEIITATIPTT